MRAHGTERSNEAKALVEGLLAAGWSKGQIATHAGVSGRTVYRWLTEGRAPHPVLLGALRGMAQQGVNNGNRERSG